MKKASPEEIRRAEDTRNRLIFTRNTIARLKRAREQEIKKTNGVYDEVWGQYRHDLILTNKLIREYDKFLDEQGVYHSNSHTEEDDYAEQTDQV